MILLFAIKICFLEEFEDPCNPEDPDDPNNSGVDRYEDLSLSLLQPDPPQRHQHDGGVQLVPAVRQVVAQAHRVHLHTVSHLVHQSPPGHLECGLADEDEGEAVVADAESGVQGLQDRGLHC